MMLAFAQSKVKTMTDNGRKKVQSVWTLTVTPGSIGQSRKVELNAEAVKRISAEIESRASKHIKAGEPTLNVDALRTLYV